jgi:hypothetical protein
MKDTKGLSVSQLLALWPKWQIRSDGDPIDGGGAWSAYPLYAAVGCAARGDDLSCALRLALLRAAIHLEKGCTHEKLRAARLPGEDSNRAW